MSEIFHISVKEYEAMNEELSLLRNNALLEKLNKLVDLLYEEKYGLYLGNNTSDLTEASVLKNWSSSNSVWDHV
jgi:hypothetical protein